VIQLCGLTTISFEPAWDIPPAIQQLLSDFQSVTMPPLELPLEHHCDRAIPLVEGAQLVNICSYRYPPALNDEIEAQVDAML
jgi:hypothetical protein